MFADVAIAIANFDFLSYKIPAELIDKLKIGSFVLVEVKSKKYCGIVVGFREQLDYKGKIKSVLTLANLSYELAEYDLDFYKWAANYYLCPLGEMLAAAIPTQLFPAIDEFGSNQLLHEQNNLTLSALTNPLVVIAKNSITEKKKSKLDEFLLAQNEDKIEFKQLKAFSNKEIASAIKNNKIKLVKNPTSTLQQSNEQQEFNSSIELNNEQKEVLDRLLQAMNSADKPFLLQGITASGKTEIYNRLINHALKQNKSVLVLLPEIALTPQTQEKISSTSSLIHSKLTNRSKLESWFQARYAKNSLIIGTRSAVFTPSFNLGLIIVDEEQDSSFKQFNKPCYNARDLSVVLAKKHSSLLLLGSATPSLESIYNVREQKYSFLELKNRAVGKLPNVSLVDLKNEARSNRAYYLALSSLKKMELVLDSGSQVLIYLNRRAYANMLVCSDCDLPQLCKNCSLPLKWHQQEQNWLCHICGYSLDYIKNCQNCNSESLKLSGFGVERIASDLKNIFFNKKVAILDSDHIKTKEQMSSLLLDIKNKQVDIIVGTQILTKGHDFPAVDLVVVPLADLALNIQDYKASERTYQQLVQVSGRAGRFDNADSQVLIQAFNIDHPAIVSAVTLDHQTFYDYLFSLRKENNDPPFVRSVLLEISALTQLKAEHSATKLQQKLAQIINEKKINGYISLAYQSVVFKKNSRFYFEILIKSKNISQIKHEIQNLTFNAASKMLGGARLIVNVDP